MKTPITQKSGQDELKGGKHLLIYVRRVSLQNDKVQKLGEIR